MSVLSALHGATSTVFSNLFVRLPIPEATPDLSQQTIIVTGANTGLGLETSRHLLRLGVGQLIMGVRSPAKGESAKLDLLASTGRDPSTIQVWPLDMSSYDSVKAFAHRAASQLPRLDGVLANAGIMTRHFALSPDTNGHESTLTVNVISTFLLCLLLLPAMRASHRQTGRPARFVIPNSALHYLAPLGELAAAADDGSSSSSIIARLDDPARADMAGRYPLSKLLVLYAVRELAGRCRAAAAAAEGSVGAGVIFNTPNPSYCVSGLGRESDGGVGVKVAERLLARTTEEGARTLYHGLVVAGEESDGQYLTNCHVQSPARHVTGECGRRIQKRFFDELIATLEGIQPGISSHI